MRHSESPNPQDRRSRTRWRKVVIVAIPLVMSGVGNIYQYLAYEANLTQYQEQQVPELDCRYEYHSIKDTLGFTITNVGLVDARGVWATESIFVVVNDQVYEGSDVPHFNWLVFDGSHTRMWDISKNHEQDVTLPALQAKAFEDLMQRFKTQLISRWEISCSAPVTGKRHTVEEYFLYSPSERMPKRLTDTVGGQTIRNRIANYLASGPKHEIRIFGPTEDFELDAPVHYLIMKDLSIQPIHAWTKLTIEEIQNSFMEITDFIEPEIDDDIMGSLRYIWTCTHGRWTKFINAKGKGLFPGKPIRMLWTYLTPEDVERVKRDPTLLGSGQRKPEKEKEVIEKARLKYIEGRASFEMMSETTAIH